MYKNQAPGLTRTRRGTLLKRALAVLASFSLVATFATATPALAADEPDAAAPLPATVSADLLRTPQINGVVWSVAVNGNTAYAVGAFTRARPSGVAAGGAGEVVRNNAMAFDIPSGTILPWNPNFNAQARTVDISPDKTQLFVGGDFTAVSGQARSKIAAFSMADGALNPNFQTSVGGTVLAISITADTVYIGGSFGSIGSESRSNLAALKRSNADRLPWAPTTDDIVHGVLVTADNSRVVVGGRFQNLNGARKIGIGAVDGSTGATTGWTSTPIPATQGTNTSWVTNMILRDGVVYASANGMGGHWFDGRFAAKVDTGDLIWLDNCYGASTDVTVMGQVMYSVSHAHDCTSVGGFPEENPQVWKRALAETIYPTGTDQAPPSNNSTYSGQPVPTLLHWYPSINTGFYTGQYQGGWAMDNNGTYLVTAGEFTRVNGVNQQGLAVFTNRETAPNKVRPEYTPDLKPTVLSLSSGTARVAWPTTWDYDDETLTYDVLRDNSLTPIDSVEQASIWWKDKSLGIVDKDLTVGSTHTYRIRVSDPWGNQYIGPRSEPVTISDAQTGPYAEMIKSDGAASYYRLDEPSGPVVYDHAGFSDADAGNGVSRGVSGAIEGNEASRLSGSSSANVTGRTSEPAPDSFTVEAWFKTGTNFGGRIIGYGNSRTGSSSSYDRHVWMDNSGRVWFGVWTGQSATLNTAKTYNDNKWHLVTASMGADGMVLSIDGVRVGQRGDTTTGQAYNGYWRIGHDNLSGWPSRPLSTGIAADIDEVAIYPTVLDRTTVAAHYNASGRTADIPAPPTDEYGKSVYADDPTIYWKLDDAASSTGAADTSLSNNDARTEGTVTKAVAGAIPGADGTAFEFNGSNAMAAATQSVTNPTVYSVEAWFKTTTDRGGKIIGFGNSNTGLSSNYDRHVYMQDDGKLVFGTYTGTTHTITTDDAFNDGTWHHVVASQSGTGMKLYVDSVLTGTDPETSAQPYTGFWRIGGDRTWGSTSSWFNGAIDEAAVYTHELSHERVNAHYAFGGVVNQNPEAAFESVVDGQNVVFNGESSTDPDGSIANWEWDFGDGTTGTGDNIQHQYDDVKTYTVKLTVTDNAGAKTTLSQDVTTELANQFPTAAFTQESTGLAASFDATGSADADGTIAAYSWDFGDGATETGATPSHTYAADGTYSVTLQVSDDDGDSTSLTQDITVTNGAPTASLTADISALDVTFDGSASTDQDGTIAAWGWDFGDGTTGTGQTANHVYAAAGTYEVTLTVTDALGATGSTATSITVDAANQGPTAAFTSEVQDLAVTVDAAGSTDPDGTIESYAWNFGDGSTGTSVTASHTYTDAGTYSVTLTVTDNRGASATNTVDVTVTAPAPELPSAAFTSSVNGTTATFDASGSSAPAGNIDAYEWDFGDGTAGTGVTPSHIYAEAGQYTVTLTVTDNVGGEGTVSQEVLVESVSAPVASIETVVTGRSIAVDGSGSTSVNGDITAYEWDFDDGTTATGATADHTYGDDGTYTVQLTVTDASGATSTTSAPIEISNALPAAEFTSSVNGLEATFDATASSDPDGTVTGYAWSFGDGATATGATAEHTYAEAGDQEVSLTVTDNSGGTNSITRTVTVADPDPEPVAYAEDSFTRTATNGWASAETGGAYGYFGSSSTFTVDDGVGRIRMASPGSGPSAYLNTVSATDTEIRVGLGNDKAATGGGIYDYVMVRDVSGAGAYLAKVRFRANGDIAISLNRSETYLTNETVISGLGYQPGDQLTLRVQAVGTSPTTLRAKIWHVGAEEPGQWQLTASDNTSGMQAPGRIRFKSYLSGSATNAPVHSLWDNVWAGRTQP